MIMRQQRIATASKVAHELFEAEAAVDLALVSLAKLQATLPQARVTANLSAVVGQDVMEQVGHTLSTVIGIRRDMVEVHGRLDELKTDIGLREMAMGGLMQKQPLMGNADEAISIAA
jgi:hypothetical protein